MLGGAKGDDPEEHTVEHSHGLQPGGRHGQWAAHAPAYVLCDVDGTLVDASGSVHEVVRAAAARATAAGLAVGFATGRGAGGLRVLQRRLALPGPHVVANGGQVRFDGRVVAAWALDDSVIGAVLDLTDVYAEFYTGDGYLVTGRAEAARPHWELLGQEPAGIVGEAPLGDVVKITVILFGNGEDRRLRAALHDLDAAVSDGTSPATPGLTYVNITHPDADKGAALRAAAQHLGVGPEATVAVGDEANDLPMLAVAGTAVAMGQADAELRAAAHFVAPGVEEQGLAAVFDAAVAWATGA